MKWPWKRAPSREQALSDYFDGELRGRQARDMDEAASSDPDVIGRLATYERLREAARSHSAPPDELSDAAYLAEVTRRIEASAPAVSRARPRARWAWASVSGVALAALVAVIWRATGPADMPSQGATGEGVLMPGASMSSRAAPTRGAGPSVQVDEEEARAPERAAVVVAESLRAAEAPPPTPKLGAADSSARDRAPPYEAPGHAAGAGTTEDVRDSVLAASAVVEEKVLPYTLQIVKDGSPIHSVGLEAPASLEFARGGTQYAVSVGRGVDGRWSVASEYRAAGELLAEERRERYFRLAGADDEGVTTREPGASFARFRIAQPLVGSTRLYAVVVTTTDARKAGQTTLPVKGSADASD